MKEILLIIFSVLIINTIVAQIATIQDEDGWTNVRSEPTMNSSSIYKVKEGELFWYDMEYKDRESDWVEIYIPEDKLTSKGYNGNSTKGYIHESRILEIEALETYSQGDFEFKYFISKFDSTGRKMIIDNRRLPRLENEAYTWGTDGYLPYNQVDSIRICLNDEIILVNENLYKDIFNINKDVEIYKLNQLIIVHHENSDGAGFYEIAWVIEGNRIKERIIGTMY